MCVNEGIPSKPRAAGIRSIMGKLPTLLWLISIFFTISVWNFLQLCVNPPFFTTLSAADLHRNFLFPALRLMANGRFC